MGSWLYLWRLGVEATRVCWNPAISSTLLNSPAAVWQRFTTQLPAGFRQVSSKSLAGRLLETCWRLPGNLPENP